MNEAPDPARIRRWQSATVAALFAGYAGYYVCRSVLPVASNGLLNDPQSGIDELGYGRLGAVGIYCYAAGKFINGVGTEYLGGRAAFLLGMGLSAGLVAVLGLAGAGPVAFLWVWGMNRFVQSLGWCGLVRTAARWFAPRALAGVMAVLSLSYLFGDALARLYLGAFARAGADWRTLFLIAAGTLTVIAIGCTVVLKSRPRDVGLPEPPPPPGNVHGADAGDARISVRRLLGPLFASRAFWLVCAMNAGLTSVRETFNYWTPRYLEKGVGVAPEIAGLLSFVFPLGGAVGCLTAGRLADRAGGKFGRVVVPLVLLTVAALGAFTTVELKGRDELALGLIAAVAVCLMGPYSFCSGVLAVNLGGKRAAAASSGVIDAVGYLCGAVVSGEIAGRVVRAGGFAPLLDILFWLGVATLAVAVAFWVNEEWRPPVRAFPATP